MECIAMIYCTQGAYDNNVGSLLYLQKKPDWYRGSLGCTLMQWTGKDQTSQASIAGNADLIVISAYVVCMVFISLTQSKLTTG